MVSSAASGEMLPMQLIFQGTENSSKALPPRAAIRDLQAQGWHFTQTSNHWSSQKSMKDFVLHVLVPWYENKIKELREAGVLET